MRVITPRELEEWILCWMLKLSNITQWRIGKFSSIEKQSVIIKVFIASLKGLFICKHKNLTWRGWFIWSTHFPLYSLYVYCTAFSSLTFGQVLEMNKSLQCNINFYCYISIKVNSSLILFAFFVCVCVGGGGMLLRQKIVDLYLYTGNRKIIQFKFK